MYVTLSPTLSYAAFVAVHHRVLDRKGWDAMVTHSFESLLSLLFLILIFFFFGGGGGGGGGTQAQTYERRITFW